MGTRRKLANNATRGLGKSCADFHAATERESELTLFFFGENNEDYTILW